jgi:hypothetical protein
MAKCPHCGKELEFTVIPRKPRAVASTAKARGVKATEKKAAAKPAVKKPLEPKTAPKRPLLKNPDFLAPKKG